MPSRWFCESIHSQICLSAHTSSVISSNNNLVTLYWDGTIQKAEPLIAALKTIEDHLGKAHPDVAKFGLHNLGVARGAFPIRFGGR